MVVVGQMEITAEDARVNLRHSLLGIAQALDAVNVEVPNHGLHVAYIAYRCATYMMWDEEQSQLAFSIGLLHDCGGVQSSHLVPLFSQCMTETFSRHCEKGYILLNECPPLSCFATPVLYHHTPWKYLKTLALADKDKQLAALIYLSNHLDHLYRQSPKDQFGNLSMERRNFIRTDLMRHVNTVFEPNMVQHMTELVDKDDFWFSMQPDYIEDMYFRMNPVSFLSGRIGLEGTIAIAEFFAKIVDAKSSFTFQHSLKVGQLSGFIAKQLGYSVKGQKMLYLAGLVHDIGKLKTPDSVLHKAGKLTTQEYTCIKRHATDTRFILQGIFRSHRLLEWASNHHERLDGSGYPMGKVAKELDKPSRIIAVSDVFQALTQFRPYRPGVPLNEALDVVRSLVEDNKLDREVFSCLDQHAEYCYQLSVGENYELIDFDDEIIVNQ